MHLDVSPDEEIAASLRVEHFLSRDLVVRIHESRDQIALAWVSFFDKLLEVFSFPGMDAAEGFPDEGIAAFCRVELFRMHCSLSPVSPGLIEEAMLTAQQKECLSEHAT